MQFDHKSYYNGLIPCINDCYTIRIAIGLDCRRKDNNNKKLIHKKYFVKNARSVYI